MPAFHVARSILINAPVEQIRNSLKDFRQWPIWSPWLITEPDAPLNYSDHQGEVGANYSWEGELIGSGNITLIGLSDNKVDMDLQFLKPFKSEANTWFDILPEGESTRVVWNMKSSLPFFMFFMVKKMRSWIGMDYERGLCMLKEYIETGKVLSRVEIIGTTKLPATTYIGIKSNCVLDDIGEVMGAHYQQLNAFLEDNKFPTDQTPFAIYDYLDMHTKMVGFTSAVPVPANTKAPTELIYGELPETQALQVDHFGHYTHLGNAWSTAMSYARTKKIKVRKRPMGLEYYPNDPAQVPIKDLQAQIFLPLKG